MMPNPELWPAIRQLVARAGFCAVASSNADGSPHLTPIGSLWLEKEPGRGLMFQRFTRQLPHNADRDERVAILATRGDTWFWLKALVRGRFDTPPAVRLVARLGPPRRATTAEIARFHAKMRLVRWTRGFQLLWGDLAIVREVTVERAIPVELGRMSGKDIPLPQTGQP